MKARLFGVNLSHEFFSYVSEEEKQEIYGRINSNQSVIYSFEYEENKPMYAAVIDVCDDAIHVREVGGSFAFRMRYCEKLCTIFAEKLGKTHVSFCTKNDIVEKIGQRLGYNASQFKNEYEKKVI